MKRNAEILDGKLRRKAGQETWETPASLEERMEQVLGELSEEPAGKETKMRFRKKKLVLLAAVLVVLAGMTAGASGLFRWNERAEEAFSNPTEEQQDAMTMAGIAKEQEVSATDQGITITAVQTLMDENTLYILLDVQAEEGIINGSGMFWRTDEDGDGQDETILFSGDENGLSSEWSQENLGLFHNIGMMWTPPVPNDAPLKPGNQGYLEISAIKGRDESWTSDSVVVAFNEYTYFTADENGKEDTLERIKGNWELRIPVSAETTAETIAYTPNHEIVVDGVPVTLKAVEISPLSVKIVFDLDDKIALQNVQAPDGGDWSDYDLEFAGFLDKNGGKIECGFYGSTGAWDYETREAVQILALSRYVDIHEIGGILLGTEGITDMTEVPLS